MQTEPLRLSRFEFTAPDFFLTPLKKLRVESDPYVNRVYLIKGDRIVAVSKLREEGKDHGR